MISLIQSEEDYWQEVKRLYAEEAFQASGCRLTEARASARFTAILDGYTPADEDPYPSNTDPRAAEFEDDLEEAYKAIARTRREKFDASQEKALFVTGLPDFHLKN